MLLLAAALSINAVERKQVLLQVCHPCHLSVCLSDWEVYCGKMADWIWIQFGVVSGVGRGMGVLDGGGDHRRGRGSFGVNVGHPIVTNGDFVA